ncbi:DUF4177 domain-containing protein [Pseudotabrizicola algicola]|uniref:DUF4177 domain-containing protein n=1 Tax=Pseudotabrizicola algicola TaxID=2709381 RepID=A0A6B3RMF1_9RHOB|nr:DUF4177 domain-containing protein [Pseudotabrizicola algicola]NEX47257.1 DUF4177 domain-containing protein [Pseudotabrizicola algicola]
MQRYEFKVIPAPKRGEKFRGVKTTEDRFAQTLTQVMNTLGAEGWDYVRADTLPCDERAGLTGTKTTYQNMLVFRRPLAQGVAATAPLAAAAVTDPAIAAHSLRADAAPAADVPALKLGGAQVPLGAAPAIGPAKSEIAAE